ncbi:uncharacterized protein LOC133036903 [Cannabis sativa]|uniref:uncharacterized protein LOC133036903 n=1 Tax=Cannabis sativa TaxID=3483 RepID=UPI0029CA9298|nr:uncharacterized protein LOC133036903 [Cannabis sativa]
MSDLSDSQVFGSGGDAFDGDQDHQEDSFIPTSISEEEVPATRDAELGPFSSTDIERMVQELAEPGTIEIRDSESTVLERDHPVHSRHTPDVKVEEMDDDSMAPVRESDEEEDAEGSGTDSVDNTQLDEPFSYEDLVSRVTKSDLTTFTRAPSMEEFSYFYDIKSVGLHNGFYYFSKWATSEINGVEGMVSNMGDWKSKWFYVFKVPGIRTDFNCRPNRLTRPTLDTTLRETAEVLGSFPVQDCDWRLLCTTSKLREHKLIPENTSLQREPVYKEPSEKQQERIDKCLSKQTSRPTSEMNFLKSAPVLNRKPKTGTATTSPIVPQKRKSNVVVTLVADSSKKPTKGTQDKGKKVVIDPAIRARNILNLQEKFVGDEFISKVNKTPTEELVPRSAELASQFIAMFSRAFVTGSKEVELVKRQNVQLQEDIKKLKQDATSKDKEHEELRKAKKQVELEAKSAQMKVEEMSRDLEVEKENGKK